MSCRFTETQCPVPQKSNCNRAPAAICLQCCSRNFCQPCPPPSFKSACGPCSPCGPYIPCVPKCFPCSPHRLVCMPTCPPCTSRVYRC